MAVNSKYSNIDIVSFTPSVISTNMTKNRSVSYLTGKVDESVEGCFKSLGRAVHTYGSRRHAMLDLITELLYGNLHACIAMPCFDIIMKLAGA